MKLIMEIVAWTIVAAIIVLIVMNASQFATAISSLTGFWGSETALFTGSGYGTSSYGNFPVKAAA